MNVQLYINGVLADFNEEINIKSQVYDIVNPDFGSTTRSFSLTIPLTEKNKDIINFVNLASGVQTANLTGLLIVNYIPVISGILKIISFGKSDFKALIEGAEWIESLNDVKIDSIWSSSDDHVLNGTNVSGSWSAAAGNLYRYPLIFMNQPVKVTPNLFYVTDFTPAWSVYQIIQRLFSTVGYQIDSSCWLASNACKELYLLAPLKTVTDDTFIDNKDFEVRVTNAADNQNSMTHNTLLTQQLTLSKAYCVFDTVTLDEGSDYSTANDRYNVPETGTYNFKIKLAVNCTHDTDVRFNAWDRTYTLTLKYYDGSTTQDLAVFTQSNTGTAGWRYNSTLIATHYSGYHHLVSGGYVYLTISIASRAYNTGATTTVYINTLQASADMSFSMTMDKNCLIPGELFTMNPDKYLPSINGVDFLQALKEAYGLVFWYDELNKKVHANTFNDFIGTNIIDYSEKVDYSDEIEFKYIADEFYKNIRLQYKGDQNDRAYTNYVASNGIPYKKDITLTHFSAKTGQSTRENPLFYATAAKTIGLIATDIPIIFGNQDNYSIYPWPEKRAKTFELRLFKWFGDVTPSTGSISWSWFSIYETSGSVKTTYPKVLTPDMVDNYTGFSKRYFAINSKKRCEITVSMSAIEFQKFKTVISTAANEGFRALYEINIENSLGLYYIQSIVFDGNRAKLELIQR